MPEPVEDKNCKYNATSENKRRLQLFSISLCVILAFLGVVIYFAASNSTKGINLESYKKASLSALEVKKDAPPQPEQVFYDANHKEINLSMFKGKILLVNIWATWCGPCVEEMPSLAALRETYKDKPINIIAISVDRVDFAQKAQQKLNELSGGKLDFYHDPLMRIAFPMRAAGFPTTIIYNEEGVEIARVSGAANWDSLEAHQLIDAILAKP